MKSSRRRFLLKNLHSAKNRQTDGLQTFCVGGVKIVNKTKILEYWKFFIEIFSFFLILNNFFNATFEK